MKILDTNVFQGPSLHARLPVLVVTLDLDPLANWTAAQLLTDRRAEMKRLLPSLTLVDETPLPEVFAQVVSALQRAAGAVRFAATIRAVAEPSRYLACVECEAAPVAQEAARLAVALVTWMAPANHNRLDPARAIRGFIEGTRGYLPDQTTRALAQEANRRGIPWFRPDDFDRTVQLGQGVHQVRIRETVTSRTSALAASIARSKSRTWRLLAQLGLPATRQLVVRSEEDAVRAAETIGYPVVVKPEDRGKSIAVSVGLSSREAVASAFRQAITQSRAVLVEAVVPGADHRLLVVDGRLVAAVRRVAAHVVGDGQRTIAALVEELNRDPRRGAGFSSTLERVDLDEEALRLLADAGFTPASVPAPGVHVRLRSASSMSAGGTSVDVTSIVHPDNRIAAERAARAVGLDIAGVDIVMPDISRSWRDVGGAILEVNQSPGLRAHWFAEGSPDVTAAVVDWLAAPPGDLRIPIAAVTGTNGKTTTTMLTAHILGLDGRVVGAATTYGVRVGAELVARGDFAGASGGSMLLLDPRVDAAVLETARRGLIRRGLAFDWCDVGAVLNIGSDHVGTDGVATMEDLAQVKRLVVTYAKRMAVLNADDKLCVGLADGLDAPVCWVSFAADSPLVRRNLETHRPAVWLDQSSDPTIILHDGARRHDLIAVADIPIAMRGAARHNVQNAMFAAAIAFGLGEDLEKIRTGLRTFVSDPSSNPGRFNVYDGLPFKIVVEYAHNAEALEAAAQFARNVEVAGQRIAVLWSMGNRVDAHYAALTRAASGGFDRFVCMEPADPRGRPPGDISRRLGLGLREAGVAEDRISVIPDEDEAVAAALAAARPGDLVMICCRDFDRTWRHITSFRPASTPWKNL